MKTIDQSNYREEVPKITSKLPRGSKQKIADETSETYVTVSNVWYGNTYKKNVVDAIVRLYNDVAKSFRPVKA